MAAVIANTAAARVLCAAAAGTTSRNVRGHIRPHSALKPFTFLAPLRLSAAPSSSSSSSVGARRSSSSSAVSVRAISVGEKLPAGELSYFDKDGNLQTISVDALTKGKKVVLFAVPGAFTPTCSQKHLPGFIAAADELKSKGVDTIACVSVNDAFVMRAWGQQVGAGDAVLMLADGSGKFTDALGVTLDLTDKGLGLRSRRYALLADDGVVTVLNLEDGGAFTVSGADEILKAL